MYMHNLERYLDKHNNTGIDENIINDFEKFEYTNEKLYSLHLNFLLENIYNIKLLTHTRKRLNQNEFRNDILNKFNYKCVVSGETCKEELTASHIIPVADNEDYDIDNGLLLRENLHKTFDNFMWSINPNTLKIEIRNNCNVGQIREYVGNVIDFNMNSYLKSNLICHYEEFKKNEISKV